MTVNILDNTINKTFIPHSLYPKRFAKINLFEYEIIIDTWTELINATKFCAQFVTKTGTSKKFNSFLKMKHHRQNIIEDYDIIKDNNNWKGIYTIQNDLYIIKGNQEAVDEIGGPYVHFYSIIDIYYTYSNSKTKHNLYDILTFWQNYNNNNDNCSNDDNNCSNDDNNCLNDNDITNKFIFNKFQELFPEERIKVIDKKQFTCGEILIVIDYNDIYNVDTKELYSKESLYFTIIISFNKESNFIVDKKCFIINIKDINKFESFIKDTFNYYKNTCH